MYNILCCKLINIPCKIFFSIFKSDIRYVCTFQVPFLVHATCDRYVSTITFFSYVAVFVMDFEDSEDALIKRLFTDKSKSDQTWKVQLKDSGNNSGAQHGGWHEVLKSNSLLVYFRVFL